MDSALSVQIFRRDAIFPPPILSCYIRQVQHLILPHVRFRRSGTVRNYFTRPFVRLWPACFLGLWGCSGRQWASVIGLVGVHSRSREVVPRGRRCFFLYDRTRCALSQAIDSTRDSYSCTVRLSCCISVRIVHRAQNFSRENAFSYNRRADCRVRSFSSAVGPNIEVLFRGRSLYRPSRCCRIFAVFVWGFGGCFGCHIFRAASDAHGQREFKRSAPVPSRTIDFVFISKARPRRFCGSVYGFGLISPDIQARCNFSTANIELLYSAGTALDIAPRSFQALWDSTLFYQAFCSITMARVFPGAMGLFRPSVGQRYWPGWCPQPFQGIGRP
eukprot:284817733_4